MCKHLSDPGWEASIKRLVETLLRRDRGIDERLDYALYRHRELRERVQLTRVNRKGINKTIH